MRLLAPSAGERVGGLGNGLFSGSTASSSTAPPDGRTGDAAPASTRPAPLPLSPSKRTFVIALAMSLKCQCTKSLRSSPLRGGKSREAGSQLRGRHSRWRAPS